MSTRLGVFAFLICAALGLGACEQPTAPSQGTTTAAPVYGTHGEGGYNGLGYNWTAERFSGPADWADFYPDGTYWGNPEVAQWHLSIKWNDEWARGMKERWKAPPYAASARYQWDTGTQGGHKWEYRIFWVGKELESSPLWKEGGYPIWVRFEVAFDNNSSPDPLFWQANTLPRDLTCPF